MKAIRFVDSVDDEHLLRAEWAVDYVDVLTVLTETEIALIEATGTNQGGNSRSVETINATSQPPSPAVES